MSASAQAIRLRRNPEFLKLWGGQTVSLFGSQVTEIALPLMAVLTLHVSAAEMGLLGTARWLPFLLFTLWAGAWCDQRRRLPLLIGADVGRALLIGLIVMLALLHVLTMPMLAGTVFLLGALTVVFEVSYYSFVPSVVRRQHLVSANTRLQASASLAQVGGPGLGGVLVQLLSAPVALAVDGVSFVVSALSLGWIRTAEPKPSSQGEADSLTRIREGLTVTFRNPFLRALAGTSALYNLFEQWILTLFVLYAVQSLGFSAGRLGVVLSSGAIGALLGSLLAGPSIRRLGVGPAVVWSVLVECTAMLLVPVVPPHESLTLPVLIVAFTFNGAGVALSSVAAVTVRQVVTPDRLLGRMNASYRFLSYGVIPLGALVGGLAGQFLGLRSGLLGGTIGLFSTVIWVYFSPLRKLQSMDDATGIAVEGPLSRTGERDQEADGGPTRDLRPARTPATASRGATAD